MEFEAWKAAVPVTDKPTYYLCSLAVLDNELTTSSISAARRRRATLPNGCQPAGTDSMLIGTADVSGNARPSAATTVVAFAA
jgi:hypothetical protein